MINDYPLKPPKFYQNSQSRLLRSPLHSSPQTSPCGGKAWRYTLESGGARCHSSIKYSAEIGTIWVGVGGIFGGYYDNFENQV